MTTSATAWGDTDAASCAPSDASHTIAVFNAVARVLHTESELRDRLRDIRDRAEGSARQALTELNALHTKRDMTPVLAGAKPLLPAVARELDELERACPPGTYFKYCDMWRQTKSQLVQICVMIHALERIAKSGDGEGEEEVDDDLLLSPDGVTAMIGEVSVGGAAGGGNNGNGDGVHSNDSGAARFRCEADDYLIGVCNCLQEMSRLCVNRVTLGDYATPRIMARFASDVHAGFRLLNFRNDALRRNFDALKYAVQRMDNVTYDLTIRKLGGEDERA